MRFYEKDPDELSFIDYYEGSEEADEILSEDAIPKEVLEFIQQSQPKLHFFMNAKYKLYISNWLYVSLFIC